MSSSYFEQNGSAPAITGPSGNSGDETSTITIKENDTAIHLFSTDESVTWSLSGGEDKNLFTIDAIL